MGRHVAALDGLRGVAVAAVVAYHIRPSWVPGGYLGVDLFFVLSGYLITSLLLDERARSGGVDLLAFAGRRLRRLLPAVLVVVVVVVVHEWRWGDLAQVEQARRHALGTLGYVANWVFIADGDSYFADVAGPPLLRHVWSLAIEEQFYVLWPLTVLVAAKLAGRRGVAAVALVAAVASMGWMAVLYNVDEPSRAYFGTDSRIFEPLIGALGAVLLPLGAAKPRWIGPIGTVGGLAWIGAVFVVDDAWSGFYLGGAALLGVASLAWIWAATQDGRAARLLGARPLVGLGVISYGVYLWHWPILWMVRRGGGSGGGADVVVVALTLAVSIASYLLIERPIRRSGPADRLLGQRWRPVGAAAVAVLAVVGGVVLATRTTVPAEAVTVDQVLEQLAAAEPGPVAEDSTGIETTSRPATVVLVGDSSAWTLGGGLVSWGTAHGPYTSPFDADEISLLNLARKGYRLVPGATTDLGGVRERPSDDLEDEAWWRATVDEVEPDLVVAMFGFHDIQGRELDGRRIEFATDDFDALARAAADGLLSDLAARAPVVVLTAPALVGADMPQPEMAAFFEESSADRSRHLNSILRDVADGLPRVSVVEFGEWLCPASETGAGLRDGCRLTADGDPARHDGVHFTGAGAALAAGWLTAPLLDAAVSTPES